MTQPAQTTGWGSRLFLLGMLFVLGRLLLVFGPHPNSDVWIYADYVREQDRAAKEGISVHELHVRELEAERQRAASQLRYTPQLDEFRNIEYPPLALTFARVPEWLMTARDRDTADKQRFHEAYTAVYQRLLALVDVALFVVVVVLVRRLFAGESVNAQAERILAYILASLALWPLLYDRLDLVVAFLIAVGFWALVSPAPWIVSMAVLAAAINFKLIPLILAPIWVIGSLPADIARRTRAALAAMLGVRTGALVGLTVLFFLPFCVGAGAEALGFFRYHESRGIEINTLYSSLMLALHGLGEHVELYSSHTSINVRSGLSPALVALAPFVVGGLLAGALALFVLHIRREAREDDGRTVSEGRLAQRRPAMFASYALLFLLIFIAANKVLSPQYLLMTLPLLPLISLEGRGCRWFLWTFVAACLVTTLHFPFLFRDLYWSVGGNFQMPTFRWIALLDIRNGLLFALTVGLALGLYRQIRGKDSPPSATGTHERHKGAVPVPVAP